MLCLSFKFFLMDHKKVLLYEYLLVFILYVHKHLILILILFKSRRIELKI